MLSVVAGDEASPVFGNGAGVGSGTLSAKTLAGLTIASPPSNATTTIADASFAKRGSAISLSADAPLYSRTPSDASESTHATNALR